MSRLTELRNNRASAFTKIASDLDSTSQQEDKRFWKVTRDKSGTGSAVIRFLPAVGDDELPWVKVYHYGFQGPTGKWFINNCPSTIGKESPVMDANRELWSTGLESDKNLARARKRKTKYISNILVIKDPGNPENEGKVFLFAYGKSIHDMIQTKAKPEFDDDKPVFVTDLWEGADFKLRIKNKDKYPTYENSEFAQPSQLLGGDEEELEKVLDQCHALSPFIAESEFKSYDVLKKEFEKVINAANIPTAAEQAQADAEETPRLVEKEIKVEKVSKAPPVEKVSKKETKIDSDDDDDSSIDYFKSLLENT
jgi:hypothetical protein